MQIAALVALALAVGGLTVAVVMLVRWGTGQVDRRGVEQDRARAEADERARVQRLSDGLAAANVKLVIERDTMRTERDFANHAALRAREELTRYVKERLVSGSADDVADEVDRLLRDPL